MSLAARGDGASQDGSVHCWLEVAPNIYAGQLLQAVLSITSDIPGVFVSLAGIRLGGRLEVAHQVEHAIPRHLQESLAAPHSPKTAYGGGQLFASGPPTAANAAFASYPILSPPHTIIPIDTTVEPSVEYSCTSVYSWPAPASLTVF